MENEFAKTLNKRKLLKENKEVVETAINSFIDNIDGLINSSDVLNKDSVEKYRISLERYLELLKKIQEPENCDNSDFSFIATVLVYSAGSILNQAKRLTNSAEDIKTMAKAFMA